MRLYLVLCLISLISLSIGQEAFPGSSSFSAPPSSSFNGQPSSFLIPSSSPSLATTLSRFNPINRFVGWFRRPKNVTINQPTQSDSLNKEFDFNNPLNKVDTDQFIDDAISQRILEESKEQQVAEGSSPFISVSDDDNKNLSSERDSEESDFKPSEPFIPFRAGKSVANAPTDKIPLTEALRIVNTSNLTDCVARVICELSCNANAYGDSGRTVFRNLIKLQFDQTIKGDDAKFYRQAASKGRQLVQGKKNCNECYSIYPQCKSDSQDLVAVSSMFKL